MTPRIHHPTAGGFPVFGDLDPWVHSISHSRLVAPTSFSSSSLCWIARGFDLRGFGSRPRNRHKDAHGIWVQRSKKKCPRHGFLFVLRFAGCLAPTFESACFMPTASGYHWRLW